MKLQVPEVRKLPEWQRARRKTRKAEVAWGVGSIDPGIRETVIALIANGFITDASCEGHSFRNRACTSFPWVRITSSFEVELDKNPLWERLLHLRVQEWKKHVSFLTAAERKTLNKMEHDLNQSAKLEINKLRNVLHEFYTEGPPPTADVKLVVYSMIGWLMPKGKIYKGDSEGCILQRGKTKDIQARLERYQAEMRRFTAFLERRLLKNKKRPRTKSST